MFASKSKLFLQIVSFFQKTYSVFRKSFSQKFLKKALELILGDGYLIKIYFHFYKLELFWPLSARQEIFHHLSRD